jgi:hypothetical protein
MGFSLFSANDKEYCKDGPYGGLGSGHSPGAWTLGYFQELAYAGLKNDPRAMRTAWTTIAATMHWDGTFSEPSTRGLRNALARLRSAGLAQ